MLNRTTRVAASSRTLAMPRTRTHTSVTARSVAHSLAALSQFFGTYIGSSLATLSRGLASLAALSALSLSLAARGDVSDVQKLEGKVTSTEAMKIYLNGSDVVGTNSIPDGAQFDNLVFVYTNAAVTGTLTLDDTVRANARVLLVGGGGAGGSGGGSNNDHGAGGGGGAGGYLEASSVTLVGGDYTITVGAGGTAKPAASIQAGGNGGSSLISTNGVTLVSDALTLEAFGGGGGGAECDGVGGVGIGSGGGGSFEYNASVHPGGACTTGQGSDGGSGSTFNRTAGGGGGAMTSGAPAVKNNVGAAGGDGRECDITGVVVTYAGGGGGGTKGANTSNIGLGGAGGGGNGAGSASPVKGENGLGGGGGGGSLTVAGANGGCGTVIVRITQLVETKVSYPTIADKIYNKENQVALDLGIKYTYTGGTLNATNADEYVLFIKPGPELTWMDGGTYETNVQWKIVKRLIEKPTVTNFVYDATDKVGVTYASELPKYCTFDASNVTNATNAGTYPFSVSLKEPENTAWDDGTTDGSIEPFNDTWTISPVKVARPERRTDLVYDGTEKQGFSSLDYERYELTDGVTNATDGGAHPFTFSLLGNDEAENYVWDVDPTTSEPYSGKWTIAAATNKITTLEMTGWRIGVGTPTKPTIKADFGEDTAMYEYGLGSTEAEVTEWITDKNAITNVGTWIVKATIAATSSWTAAEKTATFGMWTDPRKAFRNHVDITINPGNTTALTNFPALIKISESLIRGFTYADAGSTGNDIAFMPVDATDDTDPLSHEVDTWNTNGVSYIWVKVPELPVGGTTITMYWLLCDGMAAPTVVAADVWTNDYVGIWHMPASGTSVKDSTGLSDGAMVGTATASADGKIGAAASLPQSGAYINCGTKLANSELVSGFTVEGWANSANYAGTSQSRHYLFGKNNFIMLRTDSQTKIQITTPNIKDYDPVTVSLPSTGSWFHYALSFDTGVEGGVRLYINGELVDSQTAVTKDGKYFADPTSAGTMLIGTSQSYSDGQNFWGLLDEYRLSKTIRSADWIKSEYAMVTDDSTLTYSPIVHDGVMDNWWVEVPSMDKTSWDVSETKGAITNFGVLAAGTVSNIIYSVYDPAQIFESTSDITEAGLYHAYFLPAEPELYGSTNYVITISVTKRQPYSDIVGNAGDSGRILLMNNHIWDINGTVTNVDYQGWFDADNAGANRSDTSTYWHHENLTPPAGDGTTVWNLMNGTESKLYAVDGRRLWHLLNCRHGNTFPDNMKKDLQPTQNYLPWMATYSKTIKTARSAKGVQTAANRMTVGQLVMQNLGDEDPYKAEDKCAVVYSSCFTNGIGTIYFDAVNGWCRDDENYENYKIVVEIATNTTEGKEPIDDNSFTESTEIDPGTELAVTTTNLYGKLEGKWTAVPFIPFLHSAAGFAPVIPKSDTNPEGTTNVFALAVHQPDGDKMTAFYRIVVPLDITNPVRFRIRRVTRVPSTSFGVDEGGFILLDNIIASVPADSADLETAGHFAKDKIGSQVLGWELMTSVPYPSVYDKEIKGSAVPIYHVNSGDPSTTDTSGYFSSATMHYRWRYLNQTTNESDLAWKTVELNPNNGFKAVDPFVLPSRVGDVEYWFEYKLQAPYYQYVDYSSAGTIKASDYTEERGVLTNRLNDASVPTGGSDWFFRVREGKSDYSGLDIVFKRGDSAAEEPVHMALVGDHVWRGFVQTKEDQAGEISYRIEALDEQTAEFAEYAAKTNYFYCKTDNPRFPVSDSLVPGGESSWSKLTLDAVTGYIMFQIDDTDKSSMALTIVHADYQNANGWSDAHGRSGRDKDGNVVSPVFVGTSTTNAYKVGVSPSKQTFGEDFADWGSMAATNESWTFPIGLTDIQSDHMHGRKTYETFASDTNGLWDVGQGMWVAKQYRDDRDNKGVALQMEGQGKGYLHFTDTLNAPRGIESISLNARLGQFVNFDDFAYFYADNILNLQNYTFMARTAFDLSNNSGFKGNASLSLIANYLPNKGCYEARWEWLGNNAKEKQGQRLCLYRWNVIGGSKTNELIVACTNTAFDVNGVTALDTSQKFLPMFISVSNDAPNNCTYVIAAVRRSGATLGASPLKNESGYSTSNDAFKWLGVAFKDTDVKMRLTKGTYGVLSANCDGVFARPEFSHAVQATIGNFPGNGKPRDVFSNEVAANADDLQNIKNCAEDDLTDPEYPGWNIIPGRHKTSYTSADVNAVISDVNPQELQIFLGTAGRADWGSTPYTNVTVSGFGGSGMINIPFYTTKNCSMRFAIAGTTSDIRTDVVLDSVVLKQWRGGNWDDSNVWPLLPAWADDQHRDKAVGHTNFVFTSAWVTNHTVLLSAKRADLTTPSAIRSPLMDGFADDGTGGSGYIRGLGLGMISIAYANAQENACLELQIATNNVDHNTIGGYDKSFSDKIWTPFATYDFNEEPLKSRRNSGILNTYLGLHDVKGAMRVVVSTNAINKVKDITDTLKFGDVTITSIVCSDEPPVDVHSWWGWNIRTIGDDKDSEKRMFLNDYSTTAGGAGLSLAINNSVDENYDVSMIDVSDRESYIQHKPFVQTPTFTSNIVGEVVFRARKYGENDPTATVTLYGSSNATETDEGKWERIDGAVFMVSNAWYETYRAKMDPKYKSFRLAVAGVADIDEGKDGGGNGLPAGAYDPPPRVLLDEIFVSEAVNAIMGFKGVGCFRHDMSGLGEVPHVPSKGEQPICGESWGVQCEIYGAQLASDIDFSHTPRVKLHWFDGIYPWGFENWKDSPSAHSAWLSRAIETEEDRYVYRSCMRTSPDAVVPMSTVAPSYVQYTLEVVFYTKENPTVPVTNWLASSDWKIPEWYRPLDLNARYGSDGSFAAYNILDNVAPDWAWINEVNIFGDFVRWSNTDDNCQFVEIAHPPEADVSGWSVRLLEGQSGNDWVVTNVLARFGRDGLSGTKQMSSEDAEANMVFRVIGSPLSRSSGRLKKSDGTLDAVWNVDNPTLVFTSDGVISYYDPVVFQLVRASGVVEHEIIVEGTNYLESLEIESPDYIREVRDFVTNKLQKSTIVIPGYDYGGSSNSLSVIQNFGHNGMEEPENDWINTVRMTPGHRNIGQVIDPNHPVPAGEEVLVYFTMTGDHIQQSLDGSNFTNGMFSAIVTKGNPVGTNVIYRVDPWYVLDSVRTGNVSLAGQVRQTKATQPFEYELAGVAKGVSNNVTVVASAALNPRFGADWGVPENDPYRDAIVEWLKGGTDLYGNPFADVESGEIRLATHRSWWSGSVLTNLTLKEMYWLDMDPTIGNLTLLAGTAFDPGGIEHVVTRELGDSTVVLTNRRLYVYMMISNENEVVAAPAHRRGVNDFTTHWTPYVLRGVSPGESSQEYVVSTGDWSSVTFKITGMLMNGYTSFGNVDNKVPLRHFVFNENSFSAEGLSKVEVYDPYSPLSIGYNAGWKRWWDRHGHCPVVFFWMIDTRLPPVGVEQLKEDNYYGD